MNGGRMADVELDCKGLNCPMPIVRLSQAMRKMEVGERVTVEATDPAFQADVMAWATRFGHVIESFDDGAVQRAQVLKK